MNFELHWINTRLVELKVDELKSGVLDRVEALELAQQLVQMAAELMDVD